jgi:DNA-binding FadR family transcriptional regulator
MIHYTSQSLFLEPIEQSTMTEQVANRLVKLLSNGHLRPGDKLPPERELAKQLNVGRTTVREALKLLTLSGLLEARRGDGTYVSTEFTGALAKQIGWPVLLSEPELDMVVEVREALEIKAARLAAERATPEEIEQLAVFRQLAEIDGRDVKRETEIDVAFHNIVTAAAHNLLLSSLMDSLSDIIWKYIYLSNQMTENLQTTIAEHQAIYSAIAAHDPEATEKAMRQHLSISREEILKVN